MGEDFHEGKRTTYFIETLAYLFIFVTQIGQQEVGSKKFTTVFEKFMFIRDAKKCLHLIV